MIHKEAVMLEVLSLVLRVNGGIKYRNGKGHPTGFFDYSGHVNTIYVSIFPDGWVNTHDEPDRLDEDKFKFDFRLGEDWEILEELERLRKYVDALEKKEEQLEWLIKQNEQFARIGRAVIKWRGKHGQDKTGA